jgi:large subunit ribosomal protein L22
MDVTATTKNVRQAASKGRGVIARVRGLSASDALKIATESHSKAARVIEKTLKSAIANAQNNGKLAPESLWVRLAVIDEGSRSGRYWPRSRGMARPITKRTSHVKIVLTDESRGGRGKAKASGA